MAAKGHRESQGETTRHGQGPSPHLSPRCLNGRRGEDAAPGMGWPREVSGGHHRTSTLGRMSPKPLPHPGGSTRPRGRPRAHLMRAAQGPTKASSRSRPRGPMAATAVLAAGDEPRRSRRCEAATAPGPARPVFVGAATPLQRPESADGPNRHRPRHVGCELGVPPPGPRPDPRRPGQ